MSHITLAKSIFYIQAMIFTSEVIQVLQQLLLSSEVQGKGVEGVS